MSLSPDTVIRRNGEVIAAGLAEETILLNPLDSAWTYAHFNETAARIWDALAEPRTAAELIETLMRDYAVDRSTCERDTSAFVAAMSARGFLIVAAA